MKQSIPAIEKNDRLIAGLLGYGTWVASTIIAAGMALMALDQLGHGLAFPQGGFGLLKAGVALFILLPVARVALLACMFLRDRDFLFAGLSAFVLAVMGVGVLLAR
ncbi:DUF1634 domain-containing protein [Achromobacter sp. UMC71]|uniref:DUF1634 domain-containing protein n=1 Tax=Achromobacter sp. UMC71 TaxID=1862320 RepID=UPI001602A9B6|nr:DUF1634 domain-containing protein [Achromobacter sp. UMC71]MBB1627759.1 hypothetical protein [Achromobacter sp. UMC71]